MSDRAVSVSSGGTSFYGWTILAAAFVIITMSIGMLFTLAIFLKPLEESMGWSRSSISVSGSSTGW